MKPFAIRNCALAAGLIATFALCNPTLAGERGNLAGFGIGGGHAGGSAGQSPASVSPARTAPGNLSGGIRHNGGQPGMSNYAVAPNRHRNDGPGSAGQVANHHNYDGGNYSNHSERRGRHHRGGFFIYGGPSYDTYYSDNYSYSSDDDSCRYYWHRYQRTGNVKWKWRYYDCIG